MPNAQPLKTGDPQRLGDYELSGRLGEGGQGVVFLGMRGGDTYAVKLLHGPVGDERAAFLREVELAKHVARFCTAQVVDAGFEDGLPYIVSEYVDGPSLAREVALTGPRSGGALERLAVGTATAIAAIHRAGIVHRDFKPQNVLLGPDGPRVIDFGLARALDAAATVSGRGVGTPAYMAPEQIMASAVTGAVDVFSWGATMSFAANASAPFGQDSVAPVLHRILTAPPELGRLDGQLRELVSACLDKDSRNRPTGRDLLLALLGDAEGVPAEVLRSPPPHILRVDPAPIAEPEITGEAPSAYLLAGSVATPLRATPTPPPSGSPPSGPPLPDSPRTGSPQTGPAQEAPSPGVPSRPRPSRGGPSRAGDRPGVPSQEGTSPEAASSGNEPPSDSGEPRLRRNGRAAHRAVVAVAGAVIVSGAVLATVLVPMFKQSNAPPQADVRPTVTISAAQAVTPTTPPASVPARGKPTNQDDDRPRRPIDTAPPPVGPGGVAVPAIVGMDRSGAVKALKRAGFVVGTITQIDSTAKIGQVLGSQPATGSTVVKGSTVSLQVSAGVEVPSVTGLRRRAAESALASAGLAVGDVTRQCSPLPDGQVLSTRPGAGSRVSGGTHVSLTVARNGAKVPSVVGQSRPDATATLRAAGLNVTTKGQIVDNPSDVDKVLAQSIAPGTCAGPTRTVLLTIAIEGQTGPDPTDPTETPPNEPPT